MLHVMSSIFFLYKSDKATIPNYGIFARMAKRFTLSSYKKESLSKRKKLGPFIRYINRRKIPNLSKLIKSIDEQVWKEIDCTKCAICCKHMTPTYTETDIRRISIHLGMTTAAFKKQYLQKDDEEKDWINLYIPCPFLDKNNLCTIYDVRPADCKGFPHLRHSQWVLQRNVFEANLEYCPATLRMVELLHEKVIKKASKPACESSV